MTDTTMARALLTFYKKGRKQFVTQSAGDVAAIMDINPAEARAILDRIVARGLLLRDNRNYNSDGFFSYRTTKDGRAVITKLIEDGKSHRIRITANPDRVAV